MHDTRGGVCGRMGNRLKKTRLRLVSGQIVPRQATTYTYDADDRLIFEKYRNSQTVQSDSDITTVYTYGSTGTSTMQTGKQVYGWYFDDDLAAWTSYLTADTQFAY